MPVTLTLMTLAGVATAAPVVAGHIVLSAERGAPPSLSLAWTSMFLREIAANAVAIAAMPMGWSERSPAFTGPIGQAEQRTPVVLVPGFGMNRSCFFPMQAALRARGWSWVHAINRGPRGGRIPTYARHLQREVECLCAQSGQEQVDLVCHSMGGLIAAWYLQELGGDTRVRRLITMGTPWGGTRMAVFRGPLSEGADMLPDAPLIAALVEPKVPTLCIWSQQDQLMVPSQTACPPWALAEPHKAQELGMVGHLEMIANFEGIDAVSQALMAPFLPVGEGEE
ncbi:MAG: pimeloyl-ACP methyl ester carboxylesterase [Cognaticolwellia sp.]|jgi:pimeloyl-ACP methyl ester carboxylesterase